MIFLHSKKQEKSSVIKIIQPQMCLHTNDLKKSA